jgi:peptide/nickel transport system substrate-binding protein
MWHMEEVFSLTSDTTRKLSRGHLSRTDGGPQHDAPISRRQFLDTAGKAALLGGMGVAISACGSSSTSTSAPAATARHGGTLRAALSGGASSDTLDAQRLVTNVDFARAASLYDPLIKLDVNAAPQLALAQSITPNTNATAWTIRLKRGITFHNGKELTAEDVIYSLRRITNPKNPLPGATPISAVLASEIKALDRFTVHVPCRGSYATFADELASYYYYYYIVPTGYNPRNPVGTGAFKYQSFTPGTESVFVRNPDYWQAPLPYLDKVVITDYADETSQLNALASGQADVVNLLDASAIGQLESNGSVAVVSNAGGFTPFTMRVDVPPFNDVRVRQALRLVVDRKQMLDLVFGGHGIIGNDVFSIFDPQYDHSLPQREQDIGQAKSLLKAAGREDLTVQLVASDIAQGTLGAATLLAQQASAAGVKINIRQVTPTELFGSEYLKWPYAQDYYYFSKYFPQVAQSTLPSAPYNETHFNDPTYNKLYASAISEVDPAKRGEISHEMQMIDYERGGYIIPYFPPVIDAHGKHVHGIVPSRTGLSLANFNFAAVWLT